MPISNDMLLVVLGFIVMTIGLLLFNAANKLENQAAIIGMLSK